MNPTATAVARSARLQEACQYAHCTRVQTGALLLRLEGASHRTIAQRLGIAPKAAANALRKGRERLERAYDHQFRTHLRRIASILACVRNFRACRPAPVYVYAPAPGGYDPMPATVRARPHGTVADDFLESDRAFLQALLDRLS